MPQQDPFGSVSNLTARGGSVRFYRLAALAKAGAGRVDRLPYSIRILLESLLRNVDGLRVREEDVRRLAAWDPKKPGSSEVPFMPGRVVLQDFTGVPCIVDLAALRAAIARAGGDPKRINPLVPCDLVIDHSVQVDAYGSADALKINARMEFERNRERYEFLKWGSKAFDNFRLVPPATGIVHQVNLEYLATVVMTRKMAGGTVAFPDSLVGTDSHTTMINGLGVLGWGVGGIEAEAVMLGQPMVMLPPPVIGFKLSGRLPEGVTATDLVLTVTQTLRAKGVVGKFVEFFGPGLTTLPLPDRATIANMCPEYGATAAYFPVDRETLEYLKLTGRPPAVVDLAERYMKEQGLFRTDAGPAPEFSEVMELQLESVEPSLAGPKRPQDRVSLAGAKRGFRKALIAMLEGKLPTLNADRLNNWLGEGGSAKTPQVQAETVSSEVTTAETEDGFAKIEEKVAVDLPGGRAEIHHGSVVIAAITSCTNTSNPSVMVGAGLLAKKAVERGLQVSPHVKTSLAPGSTVVTEYLNKAGLTPYLEKLGFHTVGYGCTTCIAAGTPVLLANGTSRRIEQMPSAGGAAVFGPTEKGELSMALQTEAMTQGTRDCLSLVLQDGRTLVCTPDHQILCAGGRWVRADQLVPGQDRVVIGLEAPLDESSADETGYILHAGEMVFSMETPQSRLRSLAFTRLLGHLLEDGSISVFGQGRIHVGQAVDREAVLNDLDLVTGKRPAGTRYDDRKWTVVLPAELTWAIVALPGVRVGRRMNQAPGLPAFVLDDNCPVAIAREFLGGLFGADGTAPTLKRMSKYEKDATLQPPAYSQSARPEHVETLKEVMEQILRLLKRCGVKIGGAKIRQYPVRRARSSYPAARDGDPRIEVRLELPDGLSFIERVGFRYCVDKMMRSSAAAVYWRTVERIGLQRLWMSAQLEEAHQRQPDLAFHEVRMGVASALRQQEPIVFPHYSLLEGHDRFTRLPKPENRRFKPLHRDACGFPSPVELLTQLGARDWFAPLLARGEARQEKHYCVEKTSEALPTFTLSVLEVRPADNQPVFDITVDALHTFVAGTVAVSNCIGNSGPLPDPIANAVKEKDLVVAAVLSGNRNFEGRVHPQVKANYLASPMLVVAYAIAGRMDVDLTTEPLGKDGSGRKVFLKEVWPSQREISRAILQSVTAEAYVKRYAQVFEGTPEWKAIPAAEGDLYRWNEKSTYVQEPPYFLNFPKEPPALRPVRNARVLEFVGDSITTDHISPAGSIAKESPAAQYLVSLGVDPKDFNSYGARRGNDRVMVRGTFANVRLKNKLVPDAEGWWTAYMPFDSAAHQNPIVLSLSKDEGERPAQGERRSVFDAAERYRKEEIPLIVLAGKEYGSGSSRDWAAKGPALLGVKAVIAESFERIHRSNLIGMGILPLQFEAGQNAASLGLTGKELFSIEGLDNSLKPGQKIQVKADGKTFTAFCRIDAPVEAEYYRHGGILQFVLRKFLQS